MGQSTWGVLVPRLPERHSPLLVDSYTHELKQQHKMPNKGSKKAKKSGSNIFSLFSQKQIQEFKEAFGIIDCDKDGIITAPDLKKGLRGYWQANQRWGGQQHGWRGPRTNQLHPD